MPTKDIEVDRIVPDKGCPINGMTRADLGMDIMSEDVIPGEGVGAIYLCAKGWRMCTFFAGYDYERGTVKCDAEGWTGYKKKNPGRG